MNTFNARSSSITSNQFFIAGWYGSAADRNSSFALKAYYLDGSLDINFSDDGFASFMVGSWWQGNNILVDGTYQYISHWADASDGQAYSIQIQSDGKIILAGTSCNTFDYIYGTSTYFASIVRLNSDGSLDNSYGTDGISLNTNQQYIVDSMLQDDGKLITVGYGTIDWSHISEGNGIDPYVAVDSGLVRRYNTDGSVDEVFSSNNRLGDAFSQDWLSFPFSRVILNSVDLQSDEKIIVAGIKWDGTSSNNYSGYRVLRLNQDGSLDETYGENGVVSLDTTVNSISWVPIEPAGDFSSTSTILILPDDSLILGGRSLNATSDFYITHIDVNGNIDMAFGLNGNGVVESDFGGKWDSVTDLSYNQFNSKIIVSGNSNGSLILQQYNLDGSIDSSFNQNVTIPSFFDSGLTDGWELRNFNVEVSQDKIIVSGGRESYQVASFNFDGTLDRTWLSGTESDEQMAGTDVADTFRGNSGNDLLNGNGGADSLYGDTGDDLINGDDGDDSLVGGLGDDVLIGGAGNDTADYSASVNGVNIDLSQGYATGIGSSGLLETGTDALSGIENVIGGAGNDVIAAGANGSTLSGGVGNDTYIIRNSNDTIIEAGGQGTDAIEASVDIALTDSQSIEVINLTGTDSINATGNSANNTVSGNNASNVIETGSGNDVVYAGGGDDVIVGGHGEGDDTYDGGTGSHDRIKYLSALNGITINLATGQALATAGNDAAAIGIDTLSNIEDVTAGNYDDIVIGNSEANSIDGSLGNDTINGGAGNDTIDGGAGNDTIDGGDGNDIATYNEVRANYSLTKNNDGTWSISAAEEVDILIGIEMVRFSDQLYTLKVHTYGTAGNDKKIDGTAGDDYVDGLAGNDTIYGYAGNDILVGGLGADKLIGGLGDDTYIINLTSKGALEDTVTEAKNQGADTIQLSGSYLGAVKTFTLGNDLENLNLSETGSSHINLKGNASANILTGNDYANTLDGAAGADNLIGGAGNDTYVVDNAGDLVTEDSGDGTDTVQSSITYTLGSAIENLTLTGKAAINGTGNELDNTLTGNAAANVLNGAAGNDTMVGGKGNDTYYIDTTGDAVTEAANAGTDTIITSLSTYSISALTNLENLSYSGSSNAMLTGNALINTLTGGTGNDTLAGGLGNDILTGGAGNDTFVFNTVANASKNKDTITDFVSGTDVIQFSKAIFTGLGTSAGPLTSDQFSSGAGITKANDADDRIIYNTTTGALYYDADGSGKAAVAVQVAIIGSLIHPTLTSADIDII
jgi:uncharacterized delta-60 repeat protein